jgi:N-acetyl-beta-hexosaminidase
MPYGPHRLASAVASDNVVMTLAVLRATARVCTHQITDMWKQQQVIADTVGPAALATVIHTTLVVTAPDDVVAALVVLRATTITAYKLLPLFGCNKWPTYRCWPSHRHHPRPYPLR